MSLSNVLNEPIGIIGTGVAGLINAHVLLQDGFTDVTLISRDNSVGGTWARHRVYPGLFINKYVPGLFATQCLAVKLNASLVIQRSRRISIFRTRYATSQNRKRIWKSTFRDGYV